MNTTTTPFAAATLWAWLLGCLPLPAWASDDHAHDAPTPSAAAPAPARFALVSDTLELVGVLNGLQLTLYLDRTADNSPVTGAHIALDIGGQRITATPHGDGDVYDADLPAAATPGHVPVSATVGVGGVRSVLTGELDLPDTTRTADGAAHGPVWSRTAAWSAAGLAVLLTAMLAGWRGLRARRARRQRAIGSGSRDGSTNSIRNSSPNSGANGSANGSPDSSTDSSRSGSTTRSAA